MEDNYRKRINTQDYKSGLDGARSEVMELTTRQGWIVEDKPDALGWNLVRPYPMDEESKRLLALF